MEILSPITTRNETRSKFLEIVGSRELPQTPEDLPPTIELTLPHPLHVDIATALDMAAHDGLERSQWVNTAQNCSELIKGNTKNAGSKTIAIGVVRSLLYGPALFFYHIHPEKALKPNESVSFLSGGDLDHITHYPESYYMFMAIFNSGADAIIPTTLGRRTSKLLMKASSGKGIKWMFIDPFDQAWFPTKYNYFLSLLGFARYEWKPEITGNASQEIHQKGKIVLSKSRLTTNPEDIKDVRSWLQGYKELQDVVNREMQY